MTHTNLKIKEVPYFYRFLDGVRAEVTMGDQIIHTPSQQHYT